MYCRNCGTELTDNAKFCANCGDKIEIETKNKKTIKLDKKQGITFAIILLITAGIGLNEYKIYRSIIEYKALSTFLIEKKLNDIDQLEREMREKCTDNGFRGKYGYTVQGVYFKQKACLKNAETTAEKERQIQYNKLMANKTLTYLEWREQAKSGQGKVKARKKILKRFDNNEFLIKSFFDDVKGLAEHNNNDWGAVSTVIAQRYNMGGYNIPKSGAKLLYVVNNEILLKSGDYYMNETGEVEYKPELSKVRSEFKF